MRNNTSVAASNLTTTSHKLYHLVPYGMPRSRPKAFVLLRRLNSFLFGKTRLLGNYYWDSCEKQAIGTENTGIWRIPAGICNLVPGGGRGLLIEYGEKFCH